MIPNGTAAALNEAARLIEVHGWVQGDFGSEKVGYCLYGALSRAQGAPTVACGELIYRTLAEWGIPNASLVIWNDMPGRRKAEVIALLRAAAKVAEEGSE